MKKTIFSLGLVLLCFQLYAKSTTYIYQYHGHGRILIFHGVIDVANEPRVKAYQTKYLESLRQEISSQPPGFRLTGNAYYRSELKRLGVTIEDIEDNPEIESHRAFPR